MTATFAPINEVCSTATGVVITQASAQAHVTREDLEKALDWLGLTGNHSAYVKGLWLTRDQINTEVMPRTQVVRRG